MVSTPGPAPQEVGVSSPARLADRRGIWTPRRRLGAGDLLALVAAWALAVTVFGGGSGALAFGEGAGAVLAALVAMRAAGLYRTRVCAWPAAEIVRTLAAVGVATAVYAGLRCAAGVPWLRPALWGGLLSAGAVLALRWHFRMWLKHRRLSGDFVRTVVLVGTNDDAADLWTIFGTEPGLGYRVGAVVGSRRQAGPWGDHPDATDVDRVGELALACRADGVILIASALDGPVRDEAVTAAQAAGLHVQIWPGFPHVVSRRVRVAPVSGLPFLYVEPHRVTPWHHRAKRLIDVSVAGAALVVSLPVLLVAAVCIKLGDRGPVLYRSERVGRGGRTIQVLKLRTMVQGADDQLDRVATLNERTDGPLFKASEDPRVTRIGRVLRASSIDELPQLWNVLTGSMSLVGPRPALPAEVEQFDAELSRRHEMRPGITGLWQIEARDNPSFNAYRRLDLAYINNWSPALDMAILAATTHAVTGRAVRAFARSSAPSADQPRSRAATPRHAAKAIRATLSSLGDELG